MLGIAKKLTEKEKKQMITILSRYLLVYSYVCFLALFLIDFYLSYLSYVNQKCSNLKIRDYSKSCLSINYGFFD